MTVETTGLKGLLVPVIAPLDEAGRLDHVSYERHVRVVIASGAAGLWVNGTSGDFHALSEEDLVEAVGRARSVVGEGVPLIAHMGDTATRRVQERARRAIDAGADHVAAITPYYTDYTESEIVRHHALIAEVTGRPGFLYQHPATGKPPLGVEAVIGMVQEKITIGIKESGTDMAYFARLMARAGETECGLFGYHGAGARALETLAMGSAGIITVLANVIPKTCADLCRAVWEERLEDARAQQARMRLVAESIAQAMPSRRTAAPGVAAMKCLLKAVGLHAHDGVPEPLEPLSAEERARLETDVLPLVREELEG